MKIIRVAAVALNQTARDWEGNTERIRRVLSELRKRDISVACFPELCISGYGCEDGFNHPSTIQYAKEALESLIPDTKGIAVNFGLPLIFRKSIYNCTAVVADGEILGVVPKKSLAGDGIHYEPRWFKPWPEDVVENISLFGKEIPIGDLIFDIGGVRVGYEICEEAWTADRPGRKHASYGIDIECNPSASHFAFEKKEARELFVREGSRAFGSVYIYSNLLGCESGRQIYDGGNLISVDGEIIARGERFSYEDFTITPVDIDLEYTRALYSKKHWAEPTYDGDLTCITSSFAPKELQTQPRYDTADDLGWESAKEISFEEFSRAVPFALFDYMRKSYSKGFVVSVSGGCDSGAVSLLVRLGLSEAYKALGVKGLESRLPYVKNTENFRDEKSFLESFLTTVWQGSENNSEETKRAAETVAKIVGSKHHDISIDSPVALYKELVEECLGTSLNYQDHSLTLQNLQARLRSPLPWALANFEGKLLLTTSNRSESALGYCTMDGDTSGGLNPIGGVDKSFLRRWLQWMEERGPEGIGSFPELSAVNSLTPSAELLPLEETQTDEGELGPYEVCSVIEDRFMRRGQSPVEILSALDSEFGEEYSQEDLAFWLRRFFQLFGRNQWKRERLAPSFHVDHIALDPRTWCRWPILNGGFKKELEELERYVRERGKEK